jgi:hypothetical protein
MKVGSMSSVTLVMTPRAPSPTTAPRKTSPSLSRESLTMSPVPVTISSAETALDKFLFVSPEPWVPVLQAPAIEMCGNEARLCKANPFWYRVVLLSVTEGEDKPLKYPPSFLSQS